MTDRIATPDELLLAGILLGRYEPLAPHHAAAIKERLGYISEDEIKSMIATGKLPMVGIK